MINFSVGFIRFIMKYSSSHDNLIIPIAVVVAACNMLVQVAFSVAFGADHVPKIRGDRS